MTPKCACGHEYAVHRFGTGECTANICTCPQATTPTAVAGPAPDLQQAIHAATKALKTYPAFAADTETTARIAVEAAWPHMARQLQAAQAENQQLRDLLDRASMFMPWPTPTNPKLARLHTEIAAALRPHAALGQVDQPAPDEAQRLRTLLEEIQDAEIIERHTELGSQIRAKIHAALGQVDQP